MNHLGELGDLRSHLNFCAAIHLHVSVAQRLSRWGIANRHGFLGGCADLGNIEFAQAKGAITRPVRICAGFFLADVILQVCGQHPMVLWAGKEGEISRDPCFALKVRFPVGDASVNDPFRDLVSVCMGKGTHSARQDGGSLRQCEKT